MRKIATMKGVRFGYDLDYRKVGLSFSVSLDEGTGAGMFISDKKAIKIIEKFEVRDIKHLNGKKCWVETDGYSVKFLKPYKL